jgi:hypothetical protein
MAGCLGARNNVFDRNSFEHLNVAVSVPVGVPCEQRQPGRLQMPLAQPRHQVQRRKRRQKQRRLLPAVQDARHFGLNPEKLITSAFVGFALLSDVRPHTREDARLLKNRRAGYGWFPHNLSWVLKKPRRISPVKAKGQLSLFDVPKGVERRIRKLLSR